MNIKFTGPIYGSSGYSQIRKLFLKLYERGHTVRIEPFKSLSVVADRAKYETMEKTEINRPYIHITSGIAPQVRRDDSASWNIAQSMFETDTLPERWAEFYNEFEEIWTPSYFCKRAFDVKNISCIVSVIPYGIDTELFKPVIKNKEAFTFLSVGKWIDRKGWDILIKAYVQEFLGDMNVRLCIKTDSIGKEKCDMIQEIVGEECTSQMPRILINTATYDENTMPFLYNEADCYVSTSRGEAFGLGYLEAMSSGIPVIAPNWGGQTDFVNEDCGWLIPVNKLTRLSERQVSINSAYRGLWFAETEVDDVRKIMREVYENREVVRIKGQKAREFVEQNLTWDKVTDQTEKRLTDIWEKIK